MVKTNKQKKGGMMGMGVFGRAVVVMGSDSDKGHCGHQTFGESGWKQQAPSCELSKGEAATVPGCVLLLVREETFEGLNDFIGEVLWQPSSHAPNTFCARPPAWQGHPRVCVCMCVCVCVCVCVLVLLNRRVCAIISTTPLLTNAIFLFAPHAHTHMHMHMHTHT